MPRTIGPFCAPPVARHLESVLVGRERERSRLRREYDDTVADRACRLVTLLGPAGVGKSRLVADFLEHAREGADVLHGRCLNYGEGITYWPLVELLLATGAVGARLTGAGFGGCVVALVQRNHADDVAAKTVLAYGKETGLDATAFVVRAAAGAAAVDV